MKFIDEYRNQSLAEEITREIHRISKKDVYFMEVCGGHTMAIQKFGIPSLLPENIHLLSGPGCPVCVSSISYIDHAVALSRRKDTIIATFGDLIRVPGSTSSLEKEKARGKDIRIVFSVLDAINISIENPGKDIVFLAIGFETTSPGTAAGILKAEQEKLKNFYILSAHKIMPPAMTALIDEDVQINGYICPGHVSTITGWDIYKPIPEKFGLSCVISGFEPIDLLETIYMLVKQIEDNRPKVEIQYKRAVQENGNPKAQQMLDKVFELRPDWWRGLGVLEKSGYKLRDKYAHFDAENINVEVEEIREPKGCICGEILKGLSLPKDCTLYGKACTPLNPVGACMVSNEGACQAYYRYNRHG